MEKRKSLSMEQAMLINDMPEELILQIFSYLDIKSRKNTRLVCKKWNRISYSDCIRSKEVTNLTNDKNNINFVGSISPYSRHINVNFLLKMPVTAAENFMFKSRSFWQRHGQEVRSLNMSIGYRLFWVLFEIAPLCPHLEHMEIDTTSQLAIEYTPSDELFRSRVQFPKLRSLKLFGDNRSIVSILGVALMSSPMLEKIDLVGNYECEPILTLFEIAYKHVPQIQEIAIANCNVNYILSRFPEIFGLKLKTLVVKICWNIGITLPSREMSISLSILKQISEHCPNLNCLVIKNFQSDNLRCFDNPLRHLSSLTTISFYRSNISDDMLRHFAFLNQLSYVDLSYCTELTQTGIFEMFGKKLRLNMVELRLAKLGFITDDVISVIAPNIPNLKVLDLTRSKITSLSLHTIMKYNPTLRCLNLSRCKQLWPTQPSSSRIVMNHLIHLDVSDTEVSQEFVEEMLMPKLEVLIWNYSRYESKKMYSGLKHEHDYCEYVPIHKNHKEIGLDNQCTFEKVVRLRCCNSFLPYS